VSVTICGRLCKITKPVSQPFRNATVVRARSLSSMAEAVALVPTLCRRSFRSTVTSLWPFDRLSFAVHVSAIVRAIRHRRDPRPRPSIFRTLRVCCPFPRIPATLNGRLRSVASRRCLMAVIFLASGQGSLLASRVHARG
jgi:hypothetical protein